jgi:AcrR family transcriptional regulator
MGRREDKKAEKRQRIETVALQLFLDQGYDRTSIEQIISGSDIARGTFYLYYDDKFTLFEQLLIRWLQPLNESFGIVQQQLQTAETPTECVQIYQEMAMSLTSIGINFSQEILLSIREMRANHEAGRWLRQKEIEIQSHTRVLTEVAASRNLIDAPNPALVSLIISGAVERLYYEFLLGTQMGDPLDLAQQATALLSRLLGLPFTSADA